MYSPVVGIIYVFNLIIGTGALTLPKGMASAGWLIGIVLLILLCLMSYITTTFVVESLSIANACTRHKKQEISSEDDDGSSKGSYSDGSLSPRSIKVPNSQNEKSPLLHSSTVVSSSRSDLSLNKFSITTAFEMGDMADMFFNKVGRILFYLCMVIYLYGDLAIYAAAVPKSLRDVVCGNLSCDYSNSSKKSQENDICWGETITRMNVYRIFLGIFTLIFGPFAYFSVQKTKYLQILTTILRWLAFITMIVLAIIHIANRKGKRGNPPVAELKGIPNFIGISVYSFMCQHSIPSLVTPIKNKRSLSKLLAADFVLVLLFYILLGMTAIYCFPANELKDIYTLNFQDSCDATDVTFIRYFLGLFPVFTISTNFPIICVTLRNNLKALFPKSENSTINRIFYPTLAIVPPIAIAFGTNDLTTLVGVTGSYAGAGVQYLIPAFLVLMARRKGTECYGRTMISKNNLRSPFARRLWVIVIISWAILCLLFVTTNHILSWIGFN